MFVPLAFVALSFFAVDPRKPRLVAYSVILLLGAAFAAMDVLRERREGIVSYLASLPYSGQQLIVARYISLVVANVVAFSVVGILHVLLVPSPFEGISPIVFAQAWIGAVMLGLIGVGLLSWISLSRILNVRVFIAFVAIGVLVSRFGNSLSGSLLEWWTSVSGSQFWAGMGWLWVGIAVLVVPAWAWSYSLGVRNLQPNGRAPTERALSVLEYRDT
jgi:hypothetical protein